VAGARLKDGSCDYLSHQGYVRRTLDANANAESEVVRGAHAVRYELRRREP
jgi:hypothetical protein